MKKMMLCVALIALTGFSGRLPFSGTDVGKLHPVEVLAVSAAEDEIRIETDTGVAGMGETVDKAIENLKLLAAGKIFLETANYLLVQEDCIHLLDDFFGLLRPACQVYAYAGDGRWDGVAKYLESHPSGVTLLGYRQGIKEIPKLLAQGEEYQIDRS